MVNALSINGWVHLQFFYCIIPSVLTKWHLITTNAFSWLPKAHNQVTNLAELIDTSKGQYSFHFHTNNII